MIRFYSYLLVSAILTATPVCFAEELAPASDSTIVVNQVQELIFSVQDFAQEIMRQTDLDEAKRLYDQRAPQYRQLAQSLKISTESSALEAFRIQIVGALNEIPDLRGFNPESLDS